MNSNFADLAQKEKSLQDQFDFEKLGQESNSLQKKLENFAENSFTVDDESKIFHRGSSF